MCLTIIFNVKLVEFHSLCYCSKRLNFEASLLVCLHIDKRCSVRSTNFSQFINFLSFPQGKSFAISLLCYYFKMDGPRPINLGTRIYTLIYAHGQSTLCSKNPATLSMFLSFIFEIFFYFFHI